MVGLTFLCACGLRLFLQRAWVDIDTGERCCADCARKPRSV